MPIRFYATLDDYELRSIIMAHLKTRGYSVKDRDILFEMGENGLKVSLENIKIAKAK